MDIKLHQMNTVVGDIEGNTKTILDAIMDDIKSNKDVSVFPETAISGYTCGALWDRLDFVYEQENKIKEIAKKLGDSSHTVIIGFVSCRGVKRTGLPKLYNSVACINNGKIQVYDKQLLANSDHHEDRKYFKSGKETKVFKIKNRFGNTMTIGVPLCEDSWYTDHARNIPEEMVEMGAEVLISINQSYYYYEKQKVREKLFTSIAKNNNVPVYMVNACGVGDILKNVVIFDGGSLIINRYGEIVKRADNFTNDSISAHTMETESKKCINLGLDKTSKFESIWNALIFEQKEFFKQSGIPKAQVHMSGGLDSSIVGAIVATAMGPEKTVFITNPSSLNTASSTFTNAQFTSYQLGIELYVNPVEEIYQTIKRVDEDSFKKSGFEQKPAGYSTMQAVLRSVQAIAANHRFGAGIVSCGNHTENVLGWASFHDIGSIGVHQPLGDMTKLELYKFAEFINNKLGKIVIPEELYNGHKKPAAELPDAMEDPINYVAQSGICADLIRDRKSKKELMQEYKTRTLNTDYYDESIYELSEEVFKTEVDFAVRQMVRSVYKNAQSAPIVMISPRSRGFSSRETLINKYTY